MKAAKKFHCLKKGTVNLSIQSSYSKLLVMKPTLPQSLNNRSKIAQSLTKITKKPQDQLS